MKKVLVIILTSLVVIIDLEAQSIRKPWEELGSQERVEYVNAINSLTTAQVQLLANEHRRLTLNNGNAIHENSQFLPWHRIFIEHFENLIKSIDPDVNIPYWNWHNSWSSTALLFQNSGGSNTGLLGLNVNGSIWEDPINGGMFNRAFNTSLSQPTDDYDTATNFVDFTEWLEQDDSVSAAHNLGHQFIGGDMVQNYSPIDPVFYIHHAMVDKAWSDWYNDNPTAVITILDTNMPTFQGYPVSTINAQSIVNPRVQKLWYAADNELILDTYSSSNSEIYRYTTGNIVASNFISTSGSDVQFIVKSNYRIILEPGFHATQGTVFLATIESGVAAKRDLIAEIEPIFGSDETQIPGINPIPSIKSSSTSIYPNTNDGRFSVTVHYFDNSANLYTEEYVPIVKGENIYVEIFNMTGIKIYEESIPRQENDTYDFNLPLSSGMYILKLNDGNVKITSKFVVR